MIDDLKAQLANNNALKLDGNAAIYDGVLWMDLLINNDVNIKLITTNTELSPPPAITFSAVVTIAAAHFFCRQPHFLQPSPFFTLDA